MSNLVLAKALVETLPVGQPGLFNPWKEHCPFEHPDDGPDHRLARLACHLDCDPLLILVGESPGYQGARYSGIAFTSERLLGEGEIPRVPIPETRLSTRRLPFSEPSATIVWKNLKALQVADRAILWNASQMHPFKPGNVWSNRTPTADELAHGRPAMRILQEAFPRALVVAVGKKAEGLLAEMGIKAGAARHPANGGATQFGADLARILKEHF